MTAKRDLDLIVSTWLDEGPADLPDATRRAILTSLPTIRQARRGRFAPWRSTRMTTPFRLAAAAIVAVVAIGGAIYVLNPPGLFGPGGPSTTPVPSPTTQPTTSTVQAGTITLTDSGCTWDGNPGSIPDVGGRNLVQFTVRNETDTFGNFGIFRLDSGTWEAAAEWILDENAALHGGPSQPPQDFATEVGNVDAPERREYRSQLLMDPGTYGIVCSSNEPPPGLVFAVYLAGPLEIAGG